MATGKNINFSEGKTSFITLNPGSGDYYTLSVLLGIWIQGIHVQTCDMFENYSISHYILYDILRRQGHVMHCI